MDSESRSNYWGGGARIWEELVKHGRSLRSRRNRALGRRQLDPDPACPIGGRPRGTAPRAGRWLGESHRPSRRRPASAGLLCGQIQRSSDSRQWHASPTRVLGKHPPSCLHQVRAQGADGHLRRASMPISSVDYERSRLPDPGRRSPSQGSVRGTVPVSR